MSKIFEAARLFKAYSSSLIGIQKICCFSQQYVIRHVSYEYRQGLSYRRWKHDLINSYTGHPDRQGQAPSEPKRKCIKDFPFVVRDKGAQSTVFFFDW